MATSRRMNRIYQSKHRGSKRSYKTELENVQVLLAWEVGQLSEGQAASLLKLDRVSLRMLRDGAVAQAMALANEQKVQP